MAANRKVQLAPEVVGLEVVALLEQHKLVAYAKLHSWMFPPEIEAGYPESAFFLQKDEQFGLLIASSNNQETAQC